MVELYKRDRSVLLAIAGGTLAIVTENALGAGGTQNVRVDGVRIIIRSKGEGLIKSTARSRDENGQSTHRQVRGMLRRMRHRARVSSLHH